MRIAVPLYGRDIAPRLCSADRLLIVDAREGRAEQESEVPLGPDGIPRRLLRMRTLGVVTVLCGGFNRRFLPLADALGLAVAWGHVGDAREAVRLFLAGPAATPEQGRCRSAGRRRGQRRRDGSAPR